MRILSSLFPADSYTNHTGFQTIEICNFGLMKKRDCTLVIGVIQELLTKAG